MCRVLCEAVRDFVGKVSKVNEGCSEKEHDDMASKVMCTITIT